MGTGWSCSSSLADPASSLVVGLHAVPANVVSQQLSELFSGSGSYFAIQAGPCSVPASQVLVSRATPLWAAARLNPLERSVLRQEAWGLAGCCLSPRSLGFLWERGVGMQGQWEESSL